MTNIMNNFNDSQCCGCGACINACPTKALSYGEDSYHFCIPILDEKKCIGCEKCIKVCPFKIKKDMSILPKWCYAAKNNIRDRVVSSSSGGIFVELAENIIEKGGFVVGCTMDSSYHVRHIVISKKDDIVKLQKSKYVQSNMGSIYLQIKRLLQERKKILFSGTPCQVAAIKSFFENTDTSNLILVDIVCHGVPSQKLFLDYLQNLQERIGNIDSYTFRAKIRHDNGMNWFFSFSQNGREHYRNWPEDSYNFLYMKGYIYRDSCYSCPFAKSKRVADITLCDYWQWDKYHRNDFSKKSSISGIIVYTEKGKKLIDVLRNIEKVSTKYEYIVKGNRCLVNHTVKNPQRDKILEIWANQGYSSIQRWFQANMKKQIFKYKIIRHIPEWLKTILQEVRNGN